MDQILWRSTVQESIHANIFGGSKAPTPTPTPPPAPPTKSPADLAAQTAASQAATFQQENAGRASNILANPAGTSGKNFASKTLLGN